MPSMKWGDTRWGDPLDPASQKKKLAKMSRRERRAAAVARKEAYRHARVAVSMGAPTINEAALLSLARGAMWACAKTVQTNPNNAASDCIDAGVKAVADLMGDIPINLSQIEATLESEWEKAVGKRIARNERARKLRGQYAVLDRLKVHVMGTLSRDISRADFRLSKKGPGSYFLFEAKIGHAVPEIDTRAPYQITVGTDYMQFRRDNDIHRYGRGKLVLGAIPDVPNGFFLLVNAKGVEKKIVRVLDRTKPGKKASYKLLTPEKTEET